jgi:hypothetical protein
MAKNIRSHSGLLVLTLSLLVARGAAVAADLTPRSGTLVADQPVAAQFQLYCAGCHGEAGRGSGAIADTLEKQPADLTTLARRNGGAFPRDRVIAIVDGREAVKQHGPRDMPVWADWFKLEGAEGLGGAPGDEAQVRRRIEKMADYLATLQRP